MRKETINLYRFQELSEEAKERALEDLYDLNVDIMDWWDFTYEDAENIGLKITSFDTGRKNSITGKFTERPEDVAHTIIQEHGSGCSTYQTANNYLQEYNPLAERYEDAYYKDLCEEQDEIEAKLEDLAEDFLHSLLEDYLQILKNEYEYLTSKEVIIETIEANEYDFTEEGKLY